MKKQLLLSLFSAALCFSAKAQVVTTVPATVVDTNTNIVITYHPYFDPQNTMSGNNSVAFENYTDSMFVYTWLQSTRPESPVSSGDDHHAVAWGNVGSTPGLYVRKVDSNDFVWTLPNQATLYGLTGDTTADTIAVIFRNSAGTVQTENIYIPVKHAFNVGVANVNALANKVDIYPNPTDNNVSINYSFGNRNATTVRINDLIGNTILIKDLGQQQAGTANISLQNIPAGIYIISVNNGDQKVVQRLVKE